MSDHDLFDSSSSSLSPASFPDIDNTELTLENTEFTLGSQRDDSQLSDFSKAIIGLENAYYKLGVVSKFWTF